jgi:hypothetical protein
MHVPGRHGPTDALLVTTTSFQDTPGAHHDVLAASGSTSSRDATTTGGALHPRRHRHRRSA